MYTPKLDNMRTECPALKLAVINGVNFHFEVLAGLLTALRPYAHHTHVYLSPHAQTQNFNGAWEIVRWFNGVFKRAGADQIKETYDLVFLVSPDYELQDNMDMLQAMKPSLLVAFVHNAGFNVSRLQPLARRRLVPVALSPHVAGALVRHSGRSDVQWLLPVLPLHVNDDCLTFPKPWVLGLCLRGFAMQGKFSNLRRNYSSIWRQMVAHLQDIRDPQVNDTRNHHVTMGPHSHTPAAPQVGRMLVVNVLGKGQDRLHLPPQLEPHVKVHRRLSYPEFFNNIAHNVALVPSMAGDRYYTEKFSSTMLTSLITGTPVLATDQLLQAYQFLKPEAVYRQREGEEEVDAMIRVSKLGADEIIKVRLALLVLRDELNQRSGQMVQEWVHEVCKAPAGQGGGSAATTA